MWTCCWCVFLWCTCGNGAVQGDLEGGCLLGEVGPLGHRMRRARPIGRTEQKLGSTNYRTGPLRQGKRTHIGLTRTLCRLLELE